MNNTVSVVIPTYNRKDVLIRAIESAKSQTKPPAEIIVVDDNSSFHVDGFLREKFGTLVHVIRNSRNMGAAEARNIGVRAASSEFVAFLDSDDFWAPDKLERQLSLIEAEEDVDLVYCDQWIFTSSGERKPSHKTMIDHNIWEYLLKGWTAPNTSTLLIRQSLFMEMGGFDASLANCEDHDLWMRMAHSDVGVSFCPERLSFFSYETPNRLSYDFDLRLHGMKTFLSKWKKPIRDANGRAIQKQFASEYVEKVVTPLMLNTIRARRYIHSSYLFGRYLLLNSTFYKHLYEVVRRKFASDQPS